MAITVDYSVTPYLITVPKSDLSLESGTKYNLDVDVFWQLLRDYSDSPESLPFPIIYTRIPATASTPSITEVNDDYYELQFEDGLYSVNIINGNTNIRDVEVKNQVSVNTNNTTGFIDPKQLEAGLFDGQVVYDAANGVPLTTTGKTGAGDLIGTFSAPVNNWTDAITIAESRGFYQIWIRGTAVLDNTAVLSDYRLNGEGPTRSIVVIQSAAVVDGLQIFECFVTGVMDGDVTLERCVIRDVTMVNGIILNSIFNPSAISGSTPTVTLGGSIDASFVDCAAGLQNAFSEPPIIDMGGTGQSLALREWNGHVKITNMTSNELIVVELDAGVCELDSTITAGDITVRGVGRLVDNSTGTAVVTEELLDAKNLNKAVFINGEVYVNTSTGSTGTAFPKGSVGDPVNNWSDADTIRAAEGLSRIHLSGTLILGAGDSISGLSIVSDNPIPNVVVLGGGNTAFASISDCTVTGAQNGRVFYKAGCIVSNVSNFSGGIVNGLLANTLTVDATFTDTITIAQSGSAVPGTSTPILDFNSAACHLSMRDYSGGIELRNFNQGTAASLDFLSGTLIIDSTCTSGVINVRGNCRVVDELGNKLGSGIINTGLQLVNNTNDPDDSREARKHTTNKAVVSSDKTLVTVYDDDGTTVLHQFNVTSDQLTRTPV